MFLLPTMGLHIDLSCCEGETIETSNTLELPKGDCCSTIQEHNNCLSNDEICIAPTKQTFTIESQFSLSPLSIVTLPYIQLLDVSVLTEQPSVFNTKEAIPIQGKTQSFLQVFLC